MQYDLFVSYKAHLDTNAPDVYVTNISCYNLISNYYHQGTDLFKISLDQLGISIKKLVLNATIRLSGRAADAAAIKQRSLFQTSPIID